MKRTGDQPIMEILPRTKPCWRPWAKGKDMKYIIGRKVVIFFRKVYMIEQ